MSAELLREAAKLMAERAEAAERIFPRTFREAVAYIPADSRQVPHIESWQPAAAFAVAKWLGDEEVYAVEAEHLAAQVSTVAMTNVVPAYRPSGQRAIAVARAYLGRES